MIRIISVSFFSPVFFVRQPFSNDINRVNCISLFLMNFLPFPFFFIPPSEQEYPLGFLTLGIFYARRTVLIFIRPPKTPSRSISTYVNSRDKRRRWNKGQSEKLNNAGECIMDSTLNSGRETFL